MHELDRLLQELVSQAQSYPKDTDPKKRKIRPLLWEIMFPGSSLRREKKTTDDDEKSQAIYGEAKRRLAGLKKWCRDKHGAMLASDFEQDWNDVMGDVLEEVLTKIDIYKRGVDFELFKEWQKFSKISASERTPEFYSEFQKEVEKFRRRFEQRRKNKKTKTYTSEKSQSLAQSCEKLCQNIQKTEVDLGQIWNIFCDEVQQLYRPLKFWNWFAFYVKSRFIDFIRDRVKEISTAEPSGSKHNQRLIYAKAVIIFAFDILLQIWLYQIASMMQEYERKLKQIQTMEWIDRDPDGIFRGEHIRNFPDVNFRAIAILKFKQASLKEIQEHFGNRVNAQTTISPFYTRTCSYFKPIIEDWSLD
ncbi:hypothetical protein IQ270_28870 [Microcoleus sp. LEGE 07076]|uniref:hypothetical protein n=1 Tax=Microcoleus sp. LEGE 07076 TaxID=915322 RepID=UPI00187E4E99|nr:hypothetical protein [Microcoleus sp. LEGE 07076]MBE9188540.1 hypothetical protein [Microcoleus sp. LEGE 07076]